MFITLEAGEGAGKTTQCRKLKDRLEKHGLPVVLTREPGGTPLAEDLRTVVVKGHPDSMDAMTELLIFTAARRDHVNRTIKPALEQGKIVICDRYIGSTHALQGAAGTSAETIERIHDHAGIDLRPDITFYLETDPEHALARSTDRLSLEDSGEGRFERKGVRFHEQVATIFRALARSDPKWTTIDGTGTITEVSDRIMAVLLDHPKFPGSKKSD